jgi:cytoskeletal protein CcmA (bactofilin family)
MRNKQSQMPNAASGNTTLISSGTTVTGDISFSGNLDIEGKVIGSISAEPGASALLRVVAGGSVEGEIRVPSASISGSVKGNIYSAENLELTRVLLSQAMFSIILSRCRWAVRSTAVSSTQQRPPKLSQLAR